MDVETFITQHALDEKAATALRAENETVQQLVINGPSMDGARNKSSVVTGRIRKAKVQGILLDKAESINVDPAVLEQFISEHDIDQRAADELRAEDPIIQQTVMDAGPLTNANNKSAAVIGRIHKAKQGKLLRSSSLIAGGEDLNIALRKFIEESGIDEKAADILMNESNAVKKEVLEGGGLQSATNKSAALMGRVQRARKHHGGGGSGFDMEAMQKGMMGAMMMGDPMQAMMGAMMMEGMMMEQMMMGGKGGGRSGGKKWTDVEQFISDNTLDERAATEFRAEDPWVQKVCMEGGSLTSAKNPSAALFGRIRNAKKMSGMGMGMGSMMKGMGSMFSPY